MPELRLTLSLRTNGATLGIAALISLIGTGVLWYAGVYFGPSAKGRRSAGLLALFEAAMLGLVLGLADPETQERFEKADLVIAKGQANFETLYGADREVFFFLRAKCPVVAEALGVREGDAVLMRHEPSMSEQTAS